MKNFLFLVLVIVLSFITTGCVYRFGLYPDNTYEEVVAEETLPVIVINTPEPVLHFQPNYINIELQKESSHNQKKKMHENKDSNRHYNNKHHK